MKLTFVNAQEMHQAYPATFDVPTAAELSAIKPGDSVKVCAADERFWVTVTAVNDSEIQGTVDNALVFTDDHGLGYGDAIAFRREHIYDVMAAA